WKLDSSRGFPYSKDIRKFYGTNPTLGATFDYLLNVKAKSVSLKVTDVTGAIVREFRNTGNELGFHRLQWKLSGGGGGGVGRRGAGGGGGPRGFGGGSVVAAGSYRVTLNVDGKEYNTALLVENDPKADPAAIITFDLPVPGGEEEARDEQTHREEMKALPINRKGKD
ncbi:MAG TPA: hypothetical protein VLM40_03085, partial [Gemmata sp.]|nr:hypothetical protein [Gemmata sp.]